MNPIILDMFGLHPNIYPNKLLQNRVAIFDSGVAIHSAAAHPDEVIHVAPLQLGEVALLQFWVLRREIWHIVEMISCQVGMMNISPVFIEVVEILQDVLPDVPCHCTLLEQTAGPSNVLRQQHLKML